MLPSCGARRRIRSILALGALVGTATRLLGTSPASATQYGGHDVHGAIEVRYTVCSGPCWYFGDPTTDELTTPDGIGRYNHFVKDASIYWTPVTNAHEVHGAIRSAWAALAWESGPLGYPMIDETNALPAGARWNLFTGGGIWWSAATGAHAVYGQIGSRYSQVRSPRGPLGLPVGDESDVAGGRVQDFERGRMYWSPGSGGWEVYGAIGQRFQELGATSGLLGFPLAAEYYSYGGGRWQPFQHGAVYWSPATGSHETYGAIRDSYVGLESQLGLPTTGEYADPQTPGGRVQDFQHGSIAWTAEGGSVVTISS